MTLGELLHLVRAQSGGESHSPQEVTAAVGWALDALATEAAKAAGPRMLYEYKMDVIRGETKYQLPDGVRTIKEVWHDGFDPPQGYSRIPYPAQGFIESTAAYGPAATSGGYVHWQVHRTIHIRPSPSESQAGKLRIGAYGRPPLPKGQAMEVAIPWEAERWVIAKAAMLMLPPPPKEMYEAIALQYQAINDDLEMWLWRASAGVPPAATEDGVLA